MAPDADTAPHHERELALVAVSDAPDRVADQVAALSSLGPYRLDPRPEQRLRDRYLDTADGSLARRQLALRLRELDGAPLLTLKADAGGGGEDGAFERFELELPWSPAALAQVAAELARRGIVLDARAAEGDEPDLALRAAGLEIAQERETVRRPRDVRAQARRPVLAELAVDAVAFLLAGGRVRVVEVEVEARSDDADLSAIARLLEEVAPALEPWPTGKLALGRAIELGLAAGRLRARADGTLPVAAYEGLRTGGAPGAPAS